ncbi:hypothetical protein NM208_g1331 [Fusarium decemcellulare]|uniref:Uncharacterized protein n=1 Tax=Fusarium decemcellulare TaxID=57161 RepID=A0ACC1SWR9_9HYPO|nr:hypothetical protein NM208_g1331 [Fusarium decemcellulare]
MIIVAVFVSIALDISAAVGVYCQWRRSLLSVSFWLQLLLTVSFLISLFSTLHVCLVLKRDLANHRPVLKFFALISITILTFVQSVNLDVFPLKNFLLTSLQIVFYVLLQTSVLQESDALTFADINIGIPNMVVCVELFPLSLFYMWAYPWNVYTNRDGLGHFTAPDQPGRPYQGGPYGYRAWLSTFNLFGYTRAILSSFSPKHQEQGLFAETGDTVPLNPNPNQTNIELPIRTVKSRY